MPSLLAPLRKAARMADAKIHSPDGGVAPLDAIFACSVCGDTLTDVYSGPRETVQGLSDGINTKDRLVTRLYVSSCCHVICDKHIEGGNGPSFHPAGARPRAACPVCVEEGGEGCPRELYSVRGFKAGEYDPAIPKKWFSAPPMKLDGKDKDMEALRFQYLGLIRFSKNISAAYNRAVHSLSDEHKQLQAVQDLASEEHARVLALEQELERLRPIEQEVKKLRRLQARLPAIEHYLKLVPKIAEQNHLMQERLASLGFGIALEPIPNYQEPFPLSKDGTLSGDYPDEAGVEQQQTAPTHTAGRSAHTSCQAGATRPSLSPRFRRPLKRQKVESPPQANKIHVAPSSRDLMPPPTKPLSRMKTMRNIIPSLRNKLSSSRSSMKASDKHGGHTDTDIRENYYWEVANSPRQPCSDRDPSSTGHVLQHESPYTSGALPKEYLQPVTAPSESHNPSSPGLESAPAEFTFRSKSPIAMNSHRLQQGVPSEPSYIQLMDDLGRDNELELGLRDPRKRVPAHQRPANPDGQFTIKIRDHNQDFGGKDHRSPDSTLRHQSLTGVASPRHTQDRLPLNPVTPMPAQIYRPQEEADRVVSPFFEINNRNSQVYSTSRVAERERSLNRFGDYPSHRQVPTWEQDRETRRQPRSLNGLSFVTSPLDERNEPIGWEKPSRLALQPQPYVWRNLDSRGFIAKPGLDRSPFLDDSPYGFYDRPIQPRQTIMPSLSSFPFSPFSQASHSRAAPLPSAQPSIVASRSPIAPRRQENRLARVGVRSGRQWRSNHFVDPYIAPARTLFSATGRRGVRR